jgi:hypothetical protein
MSGWRNRQTRTFEGRVVNTVGVQVPLPTPIVEKHAMIRVLFLPGRFCGKSAAQLRVSLLLL